MRRWLCAAALSLFFSMPILVEAGDTMYSGVSFQVKRAEVFSTDEGVLVEFVFFEPNKLHTLVTPVHLLDIKVGSAKGTRLLATYRLICPGTVIPCWGQTLQATLFVSQQSTAKQWREKIDHMSREYEKMKTSDIPLTDKQYK